MLSKPTWGAFEAPGVLSQKHKLARPLRLLFLAGTLAASGCLNLPADAQTSVTYAAEYKQATNYFGTINLLNGNFNTISSLGSTVINDIAYCPTNGQVYAVSNSLALIKFNLTNGSIVKVGNLGVTGIESLAFRQSDGALFGATQAKLYQINPITGAATLVGNYGTPTKLNSTGQNIRFAQDDNLYVSNTSTNTDIYRISTTTGAATWMGESAGYSDLILQNTSSNMYGVFINLSGSNGIPVFELIDFNLTSFVAGGTNADGSTHQITLNLVGAGTNFPPNFNFSGNMAQAITNLTVPVSATGPTNQTVVVGNTAVLSTTASGTGPYSYIWLKNSVAISGQTNSSLTLSNVTTTAAGTYSVIVGGTMGTVTNSATLTVNKATGSITLANLNPTYNGSASAATATTVPSGLAVSLTYNGSSVAPTNAGSYTVIGTINDSNYQGSVTNTMVIAQASGGITLAGLNQTYNGSARTTTATTTPSGLAVSFTFNGSATVPTNAGSYIVIATITNPNYQGSVTNTMVIAPASGNITLGGLNQTYNGTPLTPTATTVPSGLAVNFTYNGSPVTPTSAGSYTVVGTITNPNYQGSVTNTMVIAQASGSVTLAGLNQTYNGTPRTATATTVPTGLGVNFTYNGSPIAPTNAGSYTVVGTITDANYQGSATNIMVITQASGSITLAGLNQTYNGSPQMATAITVPSGLAVSYTYNGSPTAPTNAGSYVVVGTITDPNYQGSATNAMVITQASGSVTLAGLNQTYNGSPQIPTAITVPSGLAVSFTYNGSPIAPTNAGNYTVVGTITNPNYQGSATNTMVIAQASGGITLAGLNQIYNGSTVTATVITVPSGLAVSLTYNGSPVAPTNAGSYTVVGTITDANYQGSATNTMIIAQATGSVTLTGLNQIYNGTPRTVTATTVPSGLAVSFTYNGSATVPTNAGNYTVVGTITDPNYQGGATNTMVIAQASGSLTLAGLTQTYNGSVLAATATTVPSGLAVSLTYNGSPIAPTNAGSYTVVGTITDSNYQGSATNTMVIAQASGSVTLVGLNQTYCGSAATVTATTVPTGLAVSLTYNGSPIAPTNAGSYTVVGTITDTNYQGSATNTITINCLMLTVTNLLALDKVYDGTTNATLDTTNAGLPGLLSGDSVTLITSNAVAYFADQNVGTNKLVTVTGLTLSGVVAFNYSLGNPTNLAANITPATLTITADNKSKITGQINPLLTASYSGFVAGDDTNVLSSVPILSTTATTASIPGSYPITAYDAGSTNYTIQYANGTLTVAPLPLLTGLPITANGVGQYIVSWPTISSQTYQLEYSDDLTTNIWTPVGTPFTGVDGIMAITNDITASLHRFFRLQVQ